MNSDDDDADEGDSGEESKRKVRTTAAAVVNSGVVDTGGQTKKGVLVNEIVGMD